jgi:hypothetical protein
MTARKPPQLAFEHWIDRQIEDARRGPPTRQALLDPEALVADWRRARGEGEEAP